MTDVESARDRLERTFATSRRELTGFCYRMLGDAADADDAVSETLLHAWRAIETFEARATLETWLFRLATNVCFDHLRTARRRTRSTALGPPTPAAVAQVGDALPDDAFVLPVRDDRVLADSDDPVARATARESIRLAFVAALQLLPAKQRAALILCEVLHWQASDVAALLATTVPAVHSALQRARATLAAHAGERLEPSTTEAHRATLARYVDAFERYDIDALVTLLRDDVVLTMPPYRLWLRGARDLATWFLGPGSGCRGAKLLPVALNGSAGFANYRRSVDGGFEPFALQVVELVGGRIVGHHNFLHPDRFGAFGLPARLDA